MQSAIKQHNTLICVGASENGLAAGPSGDPENLY